MPTIMSTSTHRTVRPAALMVAVAIAVTDAVLLAPPALAQAPQREVFTPPPITVQPSPLHIGDIQPGQSITRSVTLTNTADAPITFTRAATSCACAVPTFADRRTLEPGQSIELPVTYTGFEEQFGEVAQQVAVFALNHSIPVQIPVLANINRGIRPTVVHDPPGQYRAASITLEAIDDTPFRIESVNFAPPVFLDGFDPAIHEPRARYTISQDFSELQPEAIPPYLLIVTDDPRSPVLALRVINLEYEPPRIRRPFLIQASPVLTHAMPAGQVTEATVTLRAVAGQPDTLIEWFQASSEHAQVSLLGLTVDEPTSTARLRIGIRPYPDRRGLITADCWVTIAGHTEHVTLHGRAFDPAHLPARPTNEPQSATPRDATTPPAAP